MKNKYLIAVLAFALIFLGGTAYITYAQGYTPFQGGHYGYMKQFMQQEGIDYNDMYGLMNSGDWEGMQKLMEEQNINFGQMLPYMQQAHPNLDASELNDLYESCHGTAGSVNSRNFSPGQGMPGYGMWNN